MSNSKDGIGEVGKVKSPISKQKNDKWLLKNIVFIVSSGDFYNLDRNVLQSKSSLDILYGDITLDESPSKTIAYSNQKLIADYVGWMPTSESIFTYDGNKYLNTYRPPSIKPVKGDVSEWLELLNFIYGEHSDLVVQHMAFTLQRPDKKIRWQLLVHGAPRTGKTMTIKPLNMILGNSSAVIDNDRFEEGWGDIYWQKKALLFEEVMQDNMKQFNRLKAKLANDNIEQLNLKSRGMGTQRNLYSMYMFSNHENALRFNADENKLLVIKAPDHCINGTPENSAAFYKSLGDKIDDSQEFHSACYHYLMNVDISNFNYGTLPVKTDAMHKMVEASRPEYEKRLSEWIEDEKFTISNRFFSIDDVMTDLKGLGHSCSKSKVSAFLKSKEYESYQAQKKINGRKESYRFWTKDEVCKSLSPSELYSFYEVERYKK